MMSSAIIATPNGEAGELLVGYPMTGVSTSQATETLRIQLRTYMGCAITNPENIFVLPNVSFEGLLEDPNIIVAADDDTGYDGNPKVIHEAVDAGGARVAHHGTMRILDDAGKVVSMYQNCGHFGCLDSRDGVPRMWGARVFSSKPDPTKGNC